jgi:hypothetical protein
MKGFTATELLQACELALVRQPAERALALLSAAEDGAPIDDLAGLPMGRRDARLRALREATFGHGYRALVSCRSCNEPLELTFESPDFALTASAAAASRKVRLGDYTLDVRPLDSTDLAAAARCPDVTAARRVLALRAVRAVRRGQDGVPIDTIPDALLAELSAHLEAIDPDAETTLEVTCSACGVRWDAAFDVAAYLWTEIEAEALRLLHEVHCLAERYGWREADILAMSTLRRRAYLELAQA